METAETKTCKYCGETKPIDAFRLYKGKTRLNKCIACEKADQKKYKAAPKAPKTEKVVIKNSERIMPVTVAKPKPVLRKSYEFVKGDKTIIVDTNPIENARQFTFDDGVVFYLPAGVSVFDMIKAHEPEEIETVVNNIEVVETL